MTMYSKDDELELMEEIYDDLDSELKKIYQEQKNDKEELLKELALLLLYYSVVDDVLKIKRVDRIIVSTKICNKVIKFIEKESSNQIKITKTLLNSTVSKLSEFYNYKFKDTEKITNKTVEGKTYSERIWKNNKKISEYLRKQVDDFIHGKISIEKMKNNVEKAFKTSKYNAERLVEDTISRARSDVFEEFCKYTGVKKLRRNEVLDGKTCAGCKDADGEVYNFDDPARPYLPEHVKCRGYYTIEK